jgi:S-adenosylmethionine-diacylgycerolhomoserine-N-methlytransferase
MAFNHVRMNGQLRPVLRATFPPREDSLHPAYAGLWHYLFFIGRRP